MSIKHHHHLMGTPGKQMSTSLAQLKQAPSLSGKQETSAVQSICKSYLPSYGHHLLANREHSTCSSTAGCCKRSQLTLCLTDVYLHRHMSNCMALLVRGQSIGPATT
jgi:hypothetical protein